MNEETDEYLQAYWCGGCGILYALYPSAADEYECRVCGEIHWHTVEDADTKELMYIG